MNLGIGNYLVNAIRELFYDIFICGPLTLIEGLCNTIKYLSGEKLISKIIRINNYDFTGIPHEFMTFLLIAMSFLILFSSGLIINAMINKKIASTLASLFNRMIIIIILWALIPLFFWVIHFSVNCIISIIMPEMMDGRNLANIIGSIGFTKNHNSGNWYYDNGYPEWKHYDLFLASVASWFCMINLLLLALSLVIRVFELFLFYVTAPIVFVTAVTNNKWQRINIWKELVISKFINVLGIIISLTIFIKLQPFIHELSNEIAENWIIKTTFKLVFIIGSAIATYQSQSIFNNLISSSSTNMNNDLSMFSVIKQGSNNFKLGIKRFFLGTYQELFVNKQKREKVTEKNNNFKKKLFVPVNKKTISKTLKKKQNIIFQTMEKNNN